MLVLFMVRNKIVQRLIDLQLEGVHAMQVRLLVQNALKRGAHGRIHTPPFLKIRKWNKNIRVRNVWKIAVYSENRTKHKNTL
jgi:hypothetical protein